MFLFPKNFTEYYFPFPYVLVGFVVVRISEIAIFEELSSSSNLNNLSTPWSTVATAVKNTSLEQIEPDDAFLKKN